MSVSKMTGKLALAMMFALGLATGAGGCIANGTGDETEGEKTEQAATAPDKNAPTSGTTPGAASSDSTSQATGVGPVEPQPLPWWTKGSNAVRGGPSAPKSEPITTAK